MAEPLTASTAMIALAGAGLYVQLMPALGDVRRADSGSATGRDTHHGIGVASAVLVGTGALMAAACHDARPLWLSIATAIVLGGLFELTLQVEGD
jgi:hypothetical protein